MATSRYPSKLRASATTGHVCLLAERTHHLARVADLMASRVIGAWVGRYADPVICRAGVGTRRKRECRDFPVA
jgi:hypothetical protein